MALETYEAVEVVSRALANVAKALKDDNKISTKEVVDIVIKTLTDLGTEVLD